MNMEEYHQKKDYKYAVISFEQPWVYCIVLILSLPLVSKTQKGLPLNQITFILIYVTLIFIYLSTVILESKLKRFNSIHLFVLFFIGYCIINTIVRDKSISVINSFNGWRSFLFLLLLFPFSHWITNYKRVLLLRKSYIIVSVLISLWAILNHLSGSLTIGGTAGLSATTNIWGMLILLPELDLKKIGKNKFYWLSMFVLIAQNILDQRRTPFVILFLGLIFYNFLLSNIRSIYISKRKRTGILRVFKFLFVMSILVFIFFNTKRVNPRSIYLAYETRFLILKKGLDLFMGNPLLGKGFGFIQNIPQIEEQQGPIHIHNVYVNILMQGGIIGLILYLSIIIVIMKKCWTAVKKSINEHEKKILSTYLVCLISYFIFGMTSARAERPEILCLLIIIGGTAQYVLDRHFILKNKKDFGG